MARKRKKPGRLTADDWARYHEHRRMLAERVAYHEAKAREEDERRARKRGWRSLGSRLRERL